MRTVALHVLILASFLSAGATQLQLKLEFHLDYGSLSSTCGRIVNADLNSNGMEDLAFFTGSIYPHHPPRWEVWECRPFDRYGLMHADTAPYPYPPGIQTGCFRLHAAGDFDRDGLPELWGFVHEQLAGYHYRELFTCMESPHPGAYPDSMVWHTRIDTSTGDGRLYLYVDDLDRDNRYDLIQRGGILPSERPLRVWENTGNDSYQCVWNCVDTMGYDIATGDFDQDDRTDMVYFGRPHLVRECRGDNRYDVACQLGQSIGSHSEVWSALDVTGNAKPEFWTGTYRPLNPGYRLYLGYWEAIGDDEYSFHFVDSVDRWVGTAINSSACGDIDGDGVDEVLWATGTHALVYDAAAPGVLEQVADLPLSHGLQEFLCISTPDLDGNGYNELLVGGGEATDIFEVEAVRLLTPAGGEVFHPNDTCLVTWRTFAPPACDSVSLFLRRDSTYTLDTIVTGLSPADTPYVWVVPDIRAESCRVMAFAYGPGWQYDECDQPIAILAAGIEEEQQPGIRELRLDVQPNPVSGPARISYEVPRPGHLDVVLYDRLGRAVAELASGPVEPGRYSLSWNRRAANGRDLSAGVYFVRLDLEGERRMQKVVLTR